MLIAELNGERKFAPYADKGFVYTCPECGEKVLLKKGKVVTHHFSHKSGSDCSNGKGESKEHMRAKLLLYTWAVNAGMTCELEYPMKTSSGMRRADIYVVSKGVKYALEIQKSPINYEHIERRTESYRSVGVHVIWIPVIPKGKNLSSWHLWPIFAHNNRCWFWDPNLEGLWFPNLQLTTRKGAPMLDWAFSENKNTTIWRFDQLGLKPEYCNQLDIEVNPPHRATKKKIHMQFIEGVMGGFYIKDSGEYDWQPEQPEDFMQNKLVSVGSLTFKVHWFSKAVSYILLSWDTPVVEIIRLHSALNTLCEQAILVLFGEEVRTTKFIINKKSISVIPG